MASEHGAKVDSGVWGACLVLACMASWYITVSMSMLPSTLTDGAAVLRLSSMLPLVTARRVCDGLGLVYPSSSYVHAVSRSLRQQLEQGVRESHRFLLFLQGTQALTARWRSSGRTLGRGMADSSLVAGRNLSMMA